MKGFGTLIGDWHFWLLIVGYWVSSNAIGAMPMPDKDSSKGYAWFFKFANGLAANMSRAFAGKVPGTEQASIITGTGLGENGK